MSNKNHREELVLYPSTDVAESRVEGAADAVETIADRTEEEMPPQQTSPFVKPFHFIQLEDEEKQ